MFQRARAQTPAIGLDVGSESIKMLQLADSPGGLKVAAAVRVSIPDDVKGDPDRRVHFAGETLRAALRQQTFQGRQVVAALPKELVHYKTHRLAPMAPDEVCQAARIDARDLFRFDPDSADVQCIDAGEVLREDGRREVILVAAGKRYVDGFIDILHKAGARLTSLDIDPCAVWRAAARVPWGDDSAAAHPRVILDLGAAQSRVIIGRGRVMRLIRTIDVGADYLRRAISRTLGLSVTEADKLRRRPAFPSAGKLAGIRKVLSDVTRQPTELLAREVLACVRYHASTFGGPSARRIELTGGEATDPQIRSTLAATLLLPVKPMELLRGIDASAIPTANSTAHMGEWSVALGLALRSFPREPATSPAADHSQTMPIEYLQLAGGMA
jgi:type IV pilus assembly protein PilM